MRALQPYSSAAPPFPTTADSLALVKELEALPDFKKEVAGGELFLEAETLEGDGEYLEAFETYKSAAKKFAGTKIAANAKAAAEKLRTEGKPGFESACDDCRKERRACAKHKEDVKL